MGLVSFVTSRLRENAPGAVNGFEEECGVDERLLAERQRLARELHDSLLQGFFAVSMHLHAAVRQLPEDSLAKARLCDVVGLMDQTLDEGRRTVAGLRSRRPSGGSLGQALACVPKDLCLPASAEFRVVVSGKERTLAA